MSDMTVVKTREQLIEELKKYEKIVIYGYNNIAKTIYRFIRSNNLQDKVIGFTGPKRKKEEILFSFTVQEPEQFSGSENTLFLLCVSESVLTKGAERIEKIEGPKVVVDYALFCELSQEENVHIDFMCPGFTKCGTSSLQNALKKHPGVFLPTPKETYYLHWRKKYDDSPERYKEKYFANVQKNKKIGDIEPAYHNCAIGAYECFGKDLKLIFMMRNPADAAYSYFKMMMRRTEYKKQVGYYKKYKKFDVRMFDDFMNDYVFNGKDRRYKYAEIIDEYLQYFDKENMMFVLFEDLIQEPTRVLDEIQEFIGVKRKEYKSLPHSNDGKLVSKNYFCARLNRQLYRLRLDLPGNKNKKLIQYYRKMFAFFEKRTMVENKEKMLPESRERAMEFYRDDIKRLEEIMGRSLEGIWY